MKVGIDEYLSNKKKTGVEVDPLAKDGELLNSEMKRLITFFFDTIRNGMARANLIAILLARPRCCSLTFAL